MKRFADDDRRERIQYDLVCTFYDEGTQRGGSTISINHSCEKSRWRQPDGLFASGLSVEDNNNLIHKILQQYGVSFSICSCGVCPCWVWFPPHPSRIVPSTTINDEVDSARVRRGAVEGVEETVGG